VPCQPSAPHGNSAQTIKVTWWARGGAQVARELWAAEGVRGFFAGGTARVLNIAPGCAISWIVYESIKQRLLQPPE
jgi:hypothetical protein